MTSQYASPQSNVTGGVIKKRGIIVWSMAVTMGLLSMLSTLSLSMPLLGWEISDPKSKAFFGQFSLFDWIIAFAPHIVFLIACAQLFRLKKSATWLWPTAVSAHALSATYFMLRKEIEVSLNHDVIWSIGISFVLYTTAIGYVLYLAKTERLS